MTVPHDTIWQILGYPFGMDITHVRLTGCISWKSKDEFMDWKSQAWLFCLWIKVVQSVMIPIVSLFIVFAIIMKLLIGWQPQCVFNYEKENVGFAWMTWEHVCTLKMTCHGGNFSHCMNHMWIRIRECFNHSGIVNTLEVW